MVDTLGACSRGRPCAEHAHLDQRVVGPSSAGPPRPAVSRLHLWEQVQRLCCHRGHTARGPGLGGKGGGDSPGYSAGRGGFSLSGSTLHGAQCPWCLQWGSPGPGPVVTWQAGAVTMLMKLGLFSRPAMSKLPTPPVCGVKKSPGQWCLDTEPRRLAPRELRGKVPPGACWNPGRPSNPGGQALRLGVLRKRRAPRCGSPGRARYINRVFHFVMLTVAGRPLPGVANP